MLDAPVGGAASRKAIDGTLSVMVGAIKPFRQYYDLMKAMMAGSVVHTGIIGASERHKTG